MNSIDVTVSVENIAPENGTTVAPLWFAFHDGSFDLFDEGATASTAVEVMAEDGVVGLEAAIIPNILEESFALGLDPEKVATVPPESTIAGFFAASEAATNGGVQNLAFANTREPAPLLLSPGQAVASTLTLDNIDSGSNQFFSYAGMVFPTNDGFVGNDDPTAIEVFDSEGNFIGADFIIFGNQVFDAGTEVNDEDPLNVPYTLVEFLNGVDENATIQPFPGFLPPGDGGVLDFELNGEQIFANADFTTEGYQIARVTITASTPSSEPEIVFGSNEDDTLEAGIDFGNESSFVLTSAGNDLVDTSQSATQINRIFGGTGLDELLAGQQDRLFGGVDNDILDAAAGSGRNRLYGNDGNDELFAGMGDRLFAGSGDDILDATTGSGDNRLYGQDGNDTLIAGEGDRLLGGEGDDAFFVTDGGNNIMTGGEGADAFWIATGEIITSANIITDFELDVDVIGVGGIGASTLDDLGLSQVGDDAVISFSGFDLAMLRNTRVSDLQANDTFVFA